MTRVLAVPPADSSHAAAHFAGRLAYETDPSDVYADLDSAVAGLWVVDTRSAAAWNQGRIPGAHHVPTAEIAARATQMVPRDAVVVTYCWGPGCNGSTVAALEFAKLGYRVKEMIGGFEYWAREGLPVETDAGQVTRPVDDLTGPLDATCEC